MIKADQIKFSPRFLRNETYISIEWVWYFEINYLEMRELEVKVFKMRNFLWLDKKWKTPKSYIKENIANAFNIWFKDVSEYIQKFLNFLDSQIFEDKKKKSSKEFKMNLLNSLNDSILFSDVWTQDRIRTKKIHWKEIIDFDVEDRHNSQAKFHLDFYESQSRQEVKDFYSKSSSKRFSDKLVEKMNQEHDYDFVLEWIACIDKEDKKTWGLLIQNLSYELNRIYDKNHFDYDFDELNYDKFTNEEWYTDKIWLNEARDSHRIKSLETIWKWIEMIEERTWLLCCAVDWSWEFIDVEKLKKKWKWEIKSWMYLYSDWKWHVSSSINWWQKIWIMSVWVFDWTNTNLNTREIKDLRTYRLDRKLPNDFLFEWEDSQVMNYVWFEFDSLDWLEEFLTV